MLKSDHLKFVHITFIKGFYVKCISCNSVIRIENARAYIDIPGQFLIHCPICTDNFDYKTTQEFIYA